MLNKVREFLKGKKTYIVAIVTAGLGIARYYGVDIPVYIWPVMAALGFGAVKAGSKRIEESSHKIEDELNKIKSELK